MKTSRPLVLVILDGWGIGHEDEHNPIYLARTPTLDNLHHNYPHTILGAAGKAVGLPEGHQGSSEIGHLIIGAGRNVLLPQTEITAATASGALENNPVYTTALKNAKRVHILGLLSDKGVHAYDETCHALIKMCKAQQIPEIYLHVITDGRDVPPQSAKYYLKRLGADLAKVATLQGRYYAMDRDQRYERVQAAYELFTQGKAKRLAADALNAVDLAYQNGETDEFISPTLLKPEGIFKTGDVVINFNYRVDREIEITQALVEPNFSGFPRTVWPKVHYIAMTNYYQSIPCPYAFKRLEIKNSLGEVLSQVGLSQLRCTETEKWPYLTKIFNGLREAPFPGEVRELLPSDKIATYDLKPEMQALPIAKTIVQNLHAKKHDVYFINFANPDILGHTGNKTAIIKGIETVDLAMNLIYEEVLNQNGILLITADHGDAEICWDKVTEQPHTSHTDNDVPFIYVDESNLNAKLQAGSLKDVAPTILALLKLSQPEEMTGKNLIL